MPDGRFLSKAIAHDLELNTVVSFEADYLFSRCIPHLDREGRMPGHPNQVKAIACPLREKITIDAIDRCLSELAAAKTARTVFEQSFASNFEASFDRAVRTAR